MAKDSNGVPTETLKKCKEKDCTGKVDVTCEPTMLQTGCHSFSPAYSCSICTRLYWYENKRISGVKNRQGVKAFLKG